MDETLFQPATDAAGMPPGPPAGPGEMMYMSAAGPLARSARDLRTALRVTAGPDDEAAKAYSWTLPPPRRTRLPDFRVGVVLDHPQAPISSEVTALMSKTVDALARAGATIAEGWPDGVDPVASSESFGFHVQLFFAFTQLGADFATLSQVVDQEARRMAARAAWNRYFNNIDVFLCPVNFTPAFTCDARPFEQRTITTPEGERSYNDQPFWISHASLPGLPAVAAPIGRTAGGLPRRRTDSGPALRRRHGNHVCRTARGRDRRIRTPAPLKAGLRASGQTSSGPGVNGRQARRRSVAHRVSWWRVESWSLRSTEET